MVRPNHPVRTVSTIRPRRSRVSASTDIERLARRVSGRSIRSSPWPTVAAARAEAITATKSATITTPLTTAATAASRINGGRCELPTASPAMAMIGNSMRANVFQTPVTIADVDTTRLPKPHDRQIAKVAANPTAPPPGRTLLTADPAVLTMNARRWDRPGIEAVRVKV